MSFNIEHPDVNQDSHGLPGSTPNALTIQINFDDRNTVALMKSRDGMVIAAGYSRRHPKDARNLQLGLDIALARLFHKAAEVYQKDADRLLNPEPQPDAELIKAMRQANRSEQKRRKNERRREARRKWFENCAIREAEHAGNADVSNWSAHPALKYEDEGDWRGRAFGDWTP